MIGIVKVARSDWGHTRGIALALGDEAKILSHDDPMGGLSAVVILGDRWEMALAAVHAVYARVPIVHLHGGEWTPNVIDNAYRQAISQMAEWHCVAHRVHADRLIGMGIPANRIEITGAPGLDRYDAPILGRKELAQRLALDPARSWAAILLHPTTLQPKDDEADWQATCAAIGTYQPLFFRPGNDPGGDALLDRMCEYTRVTPGSRLTSDVSEDEWISLMYHADILIGNTSATVIDGPFLGKHIIEIGRRQEGRERVPYGDGKSVPRVLEVIRRCIS